MPDVIQISTKGGERWDNIALQAYGQPHLMNEIIAANPQIPRYDVLPAGIIINVPIITNSADIRTETERFPPWKR